ncbi:MAG TPA: hypothetical protein DC047_02145 [Blastocatellia bacterium]|nr:hypothetical protein [Blastocatellia bacterium]
MSKAENPTISVPITVTLSEQSVLLLEGIAEGGIYGKNRAEVAARFIDQALEDFVVFARFKLPLRKDNKQALARVYPNAEDAIVVRSKRPGKQARKR